MRRFLILLFIAVPLYAGELQQFGNDVKAMALAPVHWKKAEWTRFAEGVGAVAVVFVADHPIDTFVRRHGVAGRLSRIATPFGGQAAVDISVIMIGSGLALHRDNLLGAGRDAFESELWAGLVVTPAIKRIGGRARPFLGQGAHAFFPEQGHLNQYSSFPSGHATNAFATATAISEHYGGIVPYVAYTIATAVAYSRVNDNVHWPSDVLAGALIGRAVAKSVVHYNHKLHARPVVVKRGAGMLFDYEP
ncbi:MAG TPA: phosphatase PAP2 family protein [Thermoanaerobaculia bacterium]|nr:phosphatase PAP2 family protein [Thermoanaerobaculia bacterium]